MGLRGRTIAAAGVATAFAVGCGAFSALDGFSGGADPDAGNDLTPSPGTDAIASEDDAASPADAGAETSDAGDSTAVDAGPCAVAGMTTRICDAFERSQGVLLQTTSPENWTTYADALLVTDDLVPGKVAAFSAGGDAGTSDSFLSFSAGDVRRVRVSGRLRVLTAPLSTGRHIVTVKFNGTKTGQVVLTLLPSNGLAVSEQIISESNATHSVPPFATGWHQVALDIDLTSDKLSFKVDGVEAMPNGETFPQLPGFPATSQVVISIGTRFSSGTELASVRYDDVFIATATQ
jgi:hypothetical protein